MTCCASFTCSKNSLVALNSFYIVIACILVGVGAYAKASSVVSSITITGGIIAAGVFLFFVAVLGIIGASRHHQVSLFFYMIILSVVFLIQFFFAVACLAVTDQQVRSTIETGWRIASNETRCIAQTRFECCGLIATGKSFPNCPGLVCSDSQYPDCSQPLEHAVENSLQAAGGVGLFFSFSEILGVWLAMRYRNLKDPRANPNAFL
jgi:tetraspanin-13/31